MRANAFGQGHRRAQPETHSRFRGQRGRLAARQQDVARTGASANARADRRAFTTAGNCADNRADRRPAADLCGILAVRSFGVAATILAFMWGFRSLTDVPGQELHVRLTQFGLIATFIFLVAGASRLARFNIQTNPQPSNPGRPGRKYFVGMPIPAGAGAIAAVVHFVRGQPLSYWWLAPLWLGILIMLSFLMVSTWRFYSFKDLNLRNRHPFQVLILICGMGALIWFYSPYVLFILAVSYTLSGIITRFSYAMRRGRAEPSYKEAPEPR